MSYPRSVSIGLWIGAAWLAACGDSGTGGAGGAAAGGQAAQGGAAAVGGGNAGGAAAAGGGNAGGGSASGTQFFATGTLHHVDIVVDAQYLDTLDTDITVRVPGTVTYDGTTIQNAGIRKKGQSTLQPLAQKPSFSIKLDDTVPGQDIDGIEKFALNNTVMDPSFSSEPLTYMFYANAGVPAPRTSHAVVTFNGEMKGVYVVVEAINKQFLKEHYGDGSGNLYEGPWDFSQDPAAADLKDIEDGRTRDDLIALTDAVNGATPDTLDAAISPYADVDQLIKVVALDMAFCLWDGYAITAWNFYLYHVPDTVPSGGRFVMLPHGADWPYWQATLDPMNPDFRPWGPEYPPGMLAVSLTSPPFVDRYKLALKAVRDQAFDTVALNARLDTIDAVIHTVDMSDPVLAETVLGFEDQIDNAHNFVNERRAFLDGLAL